MALKKAKGCATLLLMKQEAIDYLKQDILTNIDMLEVLELPRGAVVAADEAGVLLQHGDIYLLSHTVGHAADFLPQMEQTLWQNPKQLVVLHSSELKETLERAFGFQTVMECRHAVYFPTTPIPYVLPEGTEIRRLDGSYADFVHAHYHMVDDPAYIRERLDAGMFGVFVGGEIAGFAGTHEERPMGLLEILPEFRRLGLAYALEAHLINHLLSLGRVPFCQVAIYNEASIRLQEKLGLTLSGQVIYWLERERIQ